MAIFHSKLLVHQRVLNMTEIGPLHLPKSTPIQVNQLVNHRTAIFQGHDKMTGELFLLLRQNNEKQKKNTSSASLAHGVLSLFFCRFFDYPTW